MKLLASIMATFAVMTTVTSAMTLNDIEDNEEDYQKVIDEGENPIEVRHCQHCLEQLENVKKGEGIIANKDFMLVFFITSFLPFVRPNLPQLKQDDIKKCKRKSKKF